VRVVALDHGAVRTGVAVSDPTGTLARPLTVVANVDRDAGFAVLLKLLEDEAPERIVVGLPVSLDGAERGPGGARPGVRETPGGCRRHPRGALR